MRYTKKPRFERKTGYYEITVPDGTPEGRKIWSFS